MLGAYRDDVGARADQGSAYVFTRSGTVWTQQAKLTAADGTANDSFGISVAISGDTALVGAYTDDVGGNILQGSAYIFTRSGTNWTQQQKLTASDGAANDRFGFSVALSGGTALVGAWLDDVGANANQGSAYVFKRLGTLWTEQQRLTASDGEASDTFGYSVVLSGDTAIIGTAFDDVGANNAQGSAYISFVGSECSSIVFNTNTDTAYSSLAPAIAAAGNGHQLLADAGALSTAAPLDFQAKSLAITSRRGIARPHSSQTILADNASLAAADGADIDLFGPLTIPSGAWTQISADQLSTGTACMLAAGAGSTLTLFVDDASLAGNTQLFADAYLSTSAGLCIPGRVGMQAGSAIITGSATDLDGPATITGASLFTGPLTFRDSAVALGTTMSAPTLTIGSLGRLTVSGDISAAVTNTSRVYTVGNTLIVGGLTNNTGAVFTVQIGVTTLIGSLVNNGTIVGVIQNPALSMPIDEESGDPGAPPDEEWLLSEARSGGTQPGDGLFIQGDFVAGPESSLSFPDAVWRMTVAGDFDVAISDSTRFDLRSAELRFAGGSEPQYIEALSTNEGNGPEGLEPGPGRFPIGKLTIGAGTTVIIVDNHDNDAQGQGAPESLYIQTVVLEPGATLNNAATPVFAETIDNNGGTVTTPENLVPIEDLCPGDADGSGVVNFADVLSVLGNFGANYGAGTGLGDADGSGIVNFTDILSVLANFNAVCP